MILRKVLLTFVGMCSIGFASENTDDENEESIKIIVIEARVANERPAGTYASPVTELRFDPATELHSRGLPEGQADVTVRGSLFENTGFKIGAVTIMDPQTGHYAAELPIAPTLLSSPDILLGIDNTLAGFNSNVTTIAYSPAKITDGGTLQVGAGNDDLQFQSLDLANVVNNSWGLTLSLARSESDGTIPNGDHEFERYNVQLQYNDVDTQSDLFIGYQDKFYGWPGAYTGFASLAETDHTKTTLLLANHHVDTNGGFWEVGGFYRYLEDNYDFDRTTQEANTLGAFDHETRVFGIGFQGQHNSHLLDWHYAGQVTADELVNSTDLTEGNFNSRKYGSFSFVPSIELREPGKRNILLRFGANIDWSSEDGSYVSPVLGITLSKIDASGNRFLTLEYASSSQLPGYTALKSRPTGLFGGNADLGRERSKQVSLTLGNHTSTWNGQLTFFYRKDNDLIDWTFTSAVPFSRQANSVDLDVTGLESIYKHHWNLVDLIFGYTYLNKDSNYSTADIDASFYALNFARHRVTLALHYHITEKLHLRLDHEFRVQEDNPLRTSSNDALVVSANLAWEPLNGKGLGFALTVDNLTDSDYQQFPGTPAVGRQISLSASYLW
ncbi:MAG: TonB-dependent receptor [Gammaproteobacteria bacterium]|nr:TonB-dependent receptor [Gammaproteobacteria bacterium]